MKPPLYRKKVAKTWLEKQKLWQVHIPPPNETKYLYYEVRKPNEQRQFDLLYLPHNIFEGSTYKYILTCADVVSGVDTASRYKVDRAPKTKKPSEVAFLLEAIHKKGGVFKEWHLSLKKMLRSCLKNNVDIRKIRTKFKHTHTAFVEGFNKELTKEPFKPMDAQELQDTEKVSVIWVKYLKSIVNKMNNTKSSMIDINPKETYPEENVLPGDGLYKYLYQRDGQH